jgi:hypothetical protein
MKIRIDNARLSWNDLYEATGFNGDNNLAFKAKIIIDDEATLAKVRNAINVALKEAYSRDSDKIVKKIQNDARSFPFKEHDDGGFSLSTRRPQKKGRPILLDENRQPVTADDQKFYAGCRVNVLVEFWAGNYSGDRVGCTLEGLQFAGDDQPFSAQRSSSVDDFETVAVATRETADDLL